MVAAIDSWHGLSMEDIRKLEVKNMEDLKEKIKSKDISMALACFDCLTDRFTAGM